MTDDSSMREQSYAYFIQEAPQLLQVLEQELLNLKQDWSINKIHTLMRATHTLKGAAASVELEGIKTVAHCLEDIFRSLCTVISIDQETEALLFEAYQCLRTPLIAEITGIHSNNTEIFERAAAIFSQLQEKLGDCFDREAYIPTSTELGFDVTQSIFEVGVTQRLEEIAKVLASGQPEEIASTLLVQAEVFLGLAESLNLPGFGAIASAAIAATTNHPDDVVTVCKTALFDFQQATAAILAGDRTSGGNPSTLLQQLAQGGEAEGAEEDEEDEEAQLDTDSLVDAIWSISDSEDEANTVETFDIIPSLTYESDSNEQHKFASTSIPDTVRVNTKHLERLNYLIGELLTNHNRQSLQDEKLQGSIQELFTQLQQHQQMLEELQDCFDVEIEPQNRTHLLVRSLLKNVDQLQAATNTIDLIAHQSTGLLEKQSRLLTNARDDCLEARMVPLSDVFSRLPSVLEQLASLHGKSVALKLSGTDILIDKTIAQKLYDPLLHLVRNAFDHGIEPLEVRSSQGKNQTGQIEIRAFNQGSNLMIEVRDDGQGLNFEQIRQQAVENNLVSLQQSWHLTEAQLIDLLFEPGFSTATAVSNLSGRGIGLDVVRAQLQALQGTVTVSSQTNQGTTFLLQIPYSLTMAKLFLTTAGSTVYALLSDTVEQILVPQLSQSYWDSGILRRLNGVDEKISDQKQIPVRKLEQILNYFSPVIAPPPSAENLGDRTLQIGQIMLLRAQDKLLALEVDQIIGEQELVIRPLDSMIVPPAYIYGASIQADGRLVLVIDGAALAKYVFDQNSNSSTIARSPSSVFGSNQNSQNTSINYLNPQPPLYPNSEFKPAVKVLLVDDSLTWRETLAKTLLNYGYQVLQVGDGYEAIEQLRSQPDIQLAICDLEMPRMNGFEFLFHRQQDPILSQIPVIILTSSTVEKHRLLACELGASTYMNKPYQTQELLTTIANLLQQN